MRLKRRRVDAGLKSCVVWALPLKRCVIVMALVLAVVELIGSALMTWPDAAVISVRRAALVIVLATASIWYSTFSVLVSSMLSKW
jgi:hypothetical protein